MEKLEPLMEKLLSEKQSALEFQKKRHEEWNENYQFYRNKVTYDRLLQRQSVNIPIMKETIKTLLAKIDDPPDLVFEELNNEKEKEIILNELWKYDYDRLNLEGLDIQDKKNVLLYGRSFKKLNFLNSEFDCDVLDIYDVLIDPKVNPLNIETARYVIHQNIFRTLKEILVNEKYDKEGKKRLKEFLLSEEGLLISAENRERLKEKLERLTTIREESYSALEEILGGGEIIVSLTEHYTHLWDEKEKKFKKYIIIYADDKIRLFQKPLEEVLGVNFYPFVSWADDLEVSDFWSDGIGDLVRVPNKILNAWFSQLVENRTLRNWGMQFFDATKEIIPQTFVPRPWGWYPLPGNPRDIIQRVDIPDLKESLPEMEFLIKIIERSSAATAIEKGVTEKKIITLGEVEMLTGRATERIISLAKFYRRAWKEFGMKWYKILEANVAPSQTIKLYKVGYKGNVFKREVRKNDWKSKAGYRVKVLSSAEQVAEKTTEIQRLIAIKGQFPDNLALQKIIQKRLLEMAGLNPEEIREVIAFEEEKLKALPALPAPLPAPETGIPIEKLVELRDLVGRALK